MQLTVVVSVENDGGGVRVCLDSNTKAATYRNQVTIVSRLKAVKIQEMSEKELFREFETPV